MPATFQKVVGSVCQAWMSACDLSTMTLALPDFEQLKLFVTVTLSVNPPAVVGK